MADSTHSKGSRGTFSSSLGFILASTGSAIGLGNLWKFPYVAGSSGGGLFLIIYIVFMIVLGVPIVMTEMAIGRKTQLNSIDAYASLKPKWKFIGALGALASFLILSFYSVVGGWVLKYFFKYLVGGNFGMSSEKYFGEFSQKAVEPVMWHLIFMAVCAVIVIAGISGGIEKVSKFMLPALFVIIIVLCIRSVTLKGASEGLKFLFFPHPSQLGSVKDTANVLVSAMGQVFFSLSLGTGIMITYGSYLHKDTNIARDSVVISFLDTFIAILAGVAILPAVFALGLDVNSGPGLIFETLPRVFEKLLMGRLFGLAFFLLVFFAAVTSAISMLEVVASYFIDHYKISRKRAVICVAVVIAVVGAFASLSLGVLSDATVMSMPFFDLLGFISDKILMPLAAFFACIFVGFIFDFKQISDEIAYTGKRAWFMRAYKFLIRWVAPILIAVIFIIGLLG